MKDEGYGKHSHEVTMMVGALIRSNRYVATILEGKNIRRKGSPINGVDRRSKKVLSKKFHRIDGLCRTTTKTIQSRKCETCENRFMNGIFKMYIKQFSQIYTIHDDFSITSKETNVNPIVFALLSNKKETYVPLFCLLLQAVNG